MRVLGSEVIVTETSKVAKVITIRRNFTNSHYNGRTPTELTEECLKWDCPLRDGGERVSLYLPRRKDQLGRNKISYYLRI